MIVFTATDTLTGKVFAGSTRRSLEDHWALLVSVENGAASGPFFDLLRERGSNGFKVKEWGSSENPADLREMLLEATTELGAVVIKGVPTAGGSTGRLDSFASVRKELEALGAPAIKPLRQNSSKQQADEMKALIAGIELRRRGGLKSARKPRPKKVVDTTATPGIVVKAGKTKAADRPKVVSTVLPTGRTGSASKEKRIREALAEQKADLESQKRLRIDQESSEMREILARLDERSKESGKTLRRR